MRIWRLGAKIAQPEMFSSTFLFINQSPPPHPTQEKKHNSRAIIMFHEPTSSYEKKKLQ